MSSLSGASVVFLAIEDIPDVLNTPDIANMLQYFCTNTHAFWVIFRSFFASTLARSCGNENEGY